VLAIHLQISSPLFALVMVHTLVQSVRQLLISALDKHVTMVVLASLRHLVLHASVTADLMESTVLTVIFSYYFITC